MVNTLDKTKRSNLEALRGFAALFVVLGHIEALHKAFDADYLPTFVVVFAPSAHMCVLVFFVLSGYVITLSNQRLTNSGEIKKYLQKRFIRIYPIYFISVLLTLIIGRFNYPFYDVLCNLFLLQVILVPALFQNGPAWSINHEVIYYLLFIPITFFKTNYKFIFCGAVVLALANYCFYPNVHTPIISSYLFGFSFWMAGACLAKYLTINKINVSYSFLLSTVFLLLATDQLVYRSGLTELINNVSFDLFKHHLLYPQVESGKIVLSYRDLAFIPYCAYFIIVFSGAEFKYRKVFFAILQIPLIYSLVLTFTEKTPAHFLSFMVPVGYYAISLVLSFTNFSFIKLIGEKIIYCGIKIGEISYAIYIIHSPLLYAVGRLNFLDNKLLMYVTKFGILIVLILGLAYLLEKKIQPLLKKFYLQSVDKHIK